MELNRKDLIDFAADVTLYVEKIGIAKVIDNFIERKSIKSEATFETPSVNDNEAQRKSCQFYDICKNPFKDEECIEVGMQDDCFE